MPASLELLRESDLPQRITAVTNNYNATDPKSWRRSTQLQTKRHPVRLHSQTAGLGRRDVQGDARQLKQSNTNPITCHACVSTYVQSSHENVQNAGIVTAACHAGPGHRQARVDAFAGVRPPGCTSPWDGSIVRRREVEIHLRDIKGTQIICDGRQPGQVATDEAQRNRCEAQVTKYK